MGKPMKEALRDLDYFDAPRIQEVQCFYCDKRDFGIIVEDCLGKTKDVCLDCIGELLGYMKGHR